MNGFGLLVGAGTLVIIGLGFIWVIRGEYFLGHLWWPYAMGLGILAVIASLFIISNRGSVLAGPFGASPIWGATEWKEQAIRAEIGWYPLPPCKVNLHRPSSKSSRSGRCHISRAL